MYYYCYQCSAWNALALAASKVQFSPYLTASTSIAGLCWFDCFLKLIFIHWLPTVLCSIELLRPYSSANNSAVWWNDFILLPSYVGCKAAIAAADSQVNMVLRGATWSRMPKQMDAIPKPEVRNYLSMYQPYQSCPPIEMRYLCRNQVVEICGYFYAAYCLCLLLTSADFACCCRLLLSALDSCHWRLLSMAAIDGCCWRLLLTSATDANCFLPL